MTKLLKEFKTSLEARKAKAIQNIEHHERGIAEAKALIKDLDAALKLIKKLKDK